MAKCILLLLLIFTNILFTFSMRGDGGGGARKRQKTVNIPTEQIIDLDSSDDEDEPPNREIAGNSQQQNLPQNMPLLGHQPPLGQISPSSTNLESASSGKRKLISEMGAPMAPREGPRKYIQTQTDQKGFPIKIIETTFHFPNKNDFRDTVQRLTGKDTDHENPLPSAANLQGHRPHQQQQQSPGVRGNFQAGQPMMPTTGQPAAEPIVMVPTPPGHHHRHHHSSPQELPPEREIAVIQSSIKMGGNMAKEQQSSSSSSSTSHQHHPQQHHHHNPSLPPKNVMMPGGSGDGGTSSGGSGTQFQPNPLEIMVDDQPRESLMNGQLKMVHAKFKEKKLQKAQLGKEIGILAGQLEEMADGHNFDSALAMAESKSSLEAELAKVGQQLGRLVEQNRAILQRMIYEENVVENPKWVEPKNNRLEDCGPGLLQCTYCDDILCEVYDSMCSWNLTLSRCVAYEIEAPAQN